MSEQLDDLQSGSAGNFRNIPPEKPNTWLWQSIAIAICCFPLFGIIALINSARVNSYYYAGYYDKSLQASQRAKIWVILGLVIGVIYSIVMTVMVLKGSYLDEISNVLNDNGFSIYNY